MFVCCLVIAVATPAIPDPNGVINGCYQRHSGNVRIVDSAVNCRNEETHITWNAQGRTGPSNAFRKDQRGNFAAVTLGSDFVNVVTLSLPAGNYVANATAALTGSVAFNTAQCRIQGSSSTLSDNVQMTIGGAAISFGAVPLVAAFTLSSSDAVSLACRATGDTIQTQPSTITAIQVGELTIQ
jgi:hypothetical protein